jgi:putative DNA primase/helicase
MFRPIGPTPIDRAPDPEARRIAYEIFERLDTLDWREVHAHRDRDRTGDEEGLPYLRFDGPGYERFIGWRTDLEQRLRSGNTHPALESHVAKYRKLIPGLALVCHLADGGSGPIADSAVRRAITWGRYLETHARRIYGSATAVAGDTARAILDLGRKLAPAVYRARHSPKGTVPADEPSHSSRIYYFRIKK